VKLTPDRPVGMQEAGLGEVLPRGGDLWVLDAGSEEWFNVPLDWVEISPDLSYVLFRS
jgi:hypothetical protein